MSCESAEVWAELGQLIVVESSAIDAFIERRCAMPGPGGLSGLHKMDGSSSSTELLTPLMWACRWCKAAAVRALVAHGANARAQHPPSLRSAAHEAAAADVGLHAAAADCIVALPDDALNLEAKGQRPIHLAAENGNWMIIQGVAQRLGSDVLGIPAKGGWTIAHFSAIAGHVTCLEKCLQAFPALSSAVDKLGRTPAHLAARHGHLKCLNLFSTSDLQVLDRDKGSVVHCAVFGAHSETVLWCCQNPFTPLELLRPDANGSSPLDIAVKLHTRSFVRQLEELLSTVELTPELRVALVSALEKGGAGGAAAVDSHAERFRVSSVGMKRWQREVTLAAIKEHFTLKIQPPDRVLLLDDCALGLAQQQWSPSGEQCPRLSSLHASFSEDLVAHGLVDESSILVPNPDPAERERLMGALPLITTFNGLSTGALEGLRGTRSVKVCWLDYCNSIEHDRNREDVSILLSGDCLGSSSVLAFTFSWRGAPTGRTGPPKDGAQYLRKHAAFLVNTIKEAASPSHSLTLVTGPVQCGQLFFLLFRST